MFRPVARTRALVSLLFSLSLAMSAAPAAEIADITTSLSPLEERLEKGEVVVGLKNVGNTKFVTGSIMINETPDKVWPIMVNPYEFMGKISPRMKEVEVMLDKSNVSVLRVTLDVPLLVLSHFTYVVESRYENNERINFKRIGGVLRDFRGSWEMSPADNGTKTKLTYAMYIDPGFPVPQWLIREGVKGELPRTLTALRDRVKAVCHEGECLERRTIVAANFHQRIQ